MIEIWEVRSDFFCRSSGEKEKPYKLVEEEEEGDQDDDIINDEEAENGCRGSVFF